MGAKKRPFKLALAPHTLRGRTSFLITRLAPLLRRHCILRLSAFGITMQHYAVLCSLGEFGTSCNSDLVTWTGIHASDLIPLLNTLQSRMCVVRDREDRDQRRAELRLTHWGKELLAQAEHALDDVENEVFAPLTSEERAALRTMLLRAVDCNG